MENTYTYARGDKDKEFVIASMKKYVDQQPEIDKFLGTLVAPLVANQRLSVLDACCGNGHLLRFLRTLSPQSSYVGIDQTPYLIEEAKSLSNGSETILFEVGDAYDLPARYRKQFDISVNWKTISWLPYYDKMLESLVAVSRRHIFLSSLFYDGDIDFEIKVREYQKEAGRDGFNAYYNVYSFPRFKQYLYGLGVKEVKGYDFEIGIDLPKPPPDQMGTHTVKLDDGKRLQISGAVVMSWKVVRIDL